MKTLTNLQTVHARILAEQEMKAPHEHEQFDDIAEDEQRVYEHWRHEPYTLTFFQDLENTADKVMFEAIGLALNNERDRAIDKLVELGTIHKVINYGRTSKYDIGR